MSAKEDPLRLPEFSTDLAKLSRKLRSIESDLAAFIRLLQAGLKSSIHATRVPGFGLLNVWKGRAISRDMRSGKSGGFRIWWLETSSDTVTLLYIYTHRSNENESRIREEVKGRLSASGY